jgi:hypothetical protein
MFGKAITEPMTVENVDCRLLVPPQTCGYKRRAPIHMSHYLKVSNARPDSDRHRR